jgi:hypothetical protein
MNEIDDPLLALILRFVMAETASDLPQEACLRLQLALIREHVAGFPAPEREARAVEWVEQHARRFRQECQGRLVRAALADDARCPDCPLSDAPDRARCAVHTRWVGLVRRYLDGELTSAEYVHQCLDLLAGHKDQLKVAGLRRPPAPG